MDDLNKLISCETRCCKSIYPKAINDHSVNWGSSADQVLFLAIRNRLGCLVKKELEKELLSIEIENKLAQIGKDCDNYEKNLRHSLDHILKILTQDQFVLIKTVSSYNHTTSDVDILVKNKNLELKLKNSLIELNSKIDIDINSHLSWTANIDISDSFAWGHLKEISINGLAISVPDPYLDTLIRIAHMPFEMGEIKLGELLHVFSQMKKLKIDILSREAKKMGWASTFKKMIVLLNSIHNHLFGEPMSKNYAINNFNKPIVFPYQINWQLLAFSVLETRSWNKLWGARYIIKDRLELWRKLRMN